MMSLSPRQRGLRSNQRDNRRAGDDDGDLSRMGSDGRRSGRPRGLGRSRDRERGPDHAGGRGRRCDRAGRRRRGVAAEVDVAPTASIPIVEAPVPPPTGWADQLTGTDGPHYWDRLIISETARVRRYKRPATIVLVEIAGLTRLGQLWGPTSPSGRSSAPPGRFRSRSGPATTSPASSRSGSGSCSPRRPRSTRSTSSSAPGSRANVTCGSRPRWSGSRSAGPARRSRATWPMRSRWPPVDSSPS